MMRDLKACIVCFSTNRKLHSLDNVLLTEFNTVSGLKIFNGNGMPEFLCWECKAYVKKFHMFRERCHRANYVLQKLLDKVDKISIRTLSSVNRHKLKLVPTISFLPKVCYLTGGTQSNPNIEIKVEHNEKNAHTKGGNKMQKSLGTQTAKSNLLKVSSLSQTKVTLASYHPDFENDNGNDEYNIQPLNDVSKVECDETFDDWDAKSEPEMFDDVSFKEDETLDQDYAVLMPINSTEARAAAEVIKHTSNGEHECGCGMRFSKEDAYNVHVRKHNKFHSGLFSCSICNIYFKTDSQLGCHFKDNHLYKYVCKNCPEVSFTRASAKKHYAVKHTQRDINNGNLKDWKTEPKPKWSRNKTKKPKKAIKEKSVLPKTWKKCRKTPVDFPVYSPISHEEQYRMVEQRKFSRNYLESSYRCEFCYRGYRLASTYNRHMVKHDPKVSGKFQCDMCKLYFPTARKMYKHMICYHVFKYSCQQCDFVCTSKGIALYHYRWHNNVMYDCPHCDKQFSKISSQLTHIRYKHPTTDLCNMCGHSFISVGGLNCHKQMSHSKEEIETSALLMSNKDTKSHLFCAACDMQFYNEHAYTTHLSSSGKHVDTNLAVNRSEASGRCGMRARNRVSEGARPRRLHRSSHIVNNGTSTSNHCEVCGVFLSSDVVARKHYEAEHPGTEYLKRYMCHVCGHTTKQYANLLVHMRVHTREKPYPCPHCDRKFSLPSNRDRHLVVHTGEKRYQCQHCSRRFTQSTAVKLHIQTVHLKIPYKPWDKNNRRRRKDNQANATTDVSSVLPPPAPEHKIILDPQAEYITYIAFPHQDTIP